MTFPQFCLIGSWRSPDAAQREAVRCRAGVYLADIRKVGPGSAEQREERCTASRHETHSAACALISAETSRMARANCSAGCAPDTAYFCANTNVGTPEMPLSEAS